MKRMLYLEARKNQYVLPDGKSLIIRSEQTALRRYPLRYLAGVEAKGQGYLSLGAIQLLLEESIPIVFRKTNGELVGYAHGVSGHCSTLGDRLIEALWIEGFREEYSVWRASMERKLVLRCVSALRLARTDLRVRCVEENLRQRLLAQYPKLEVKTLLEEFRAGLESESARYLLNDGFDGRFLRKGQGSFR